MYFDESCDRFSFEKEPVSATFSNFFGAFGEKKRFVDWEPAIHTPRVFSLNIVDRLSYS